ncbi:hypothetical protein G9A89_008084 [Geosiphon pyriformis]|nr:hypothetical protein G9A89_008084 [Geosiphon pyriformis]
MTRSNVYGEGGGPGAQEARHGNHVWESIGKVRQHLHSLMYPDLVECADLVMDLYVNLVKGFVFKEWIVDSSRIPAQLNPGAEGFVRMFMNLHRVKIWQPSVEDLVNQGFLSSLSGVK